VVHVRAVPILLQVQLPVVPAPQGALTAIAQPTAQDVTQEMA
jgi:hypothetical protein